MLARKSCVSRVTICGRAVEMPSPLARRIAIEENLHFALRIDPPPGNNLLDGRGARRNCKEMTMARTGLSFDEYVDLKIKPRAGADPVFQEAADLELAEMFPMTVAQASEHLRSRGYDCRPEMLELLIQNGVVSPANQNAWSQADVDAAAEHLEECQIHTPYVVMCMALGCRYADFLRAVREAAERESAKYGRRVPMDDQYFVMHRIPPRGGPDGHDAIITFTLADDIRERLERGEEV